VGNNENGQCDVEGWTDIEKIYKGYQNTIGLKKDGTVVAVGNNSCGQCDVEDWTDIISINSEIKCTIGLKK
ncbi:RCC1 domain-containing protein, partial [Clostridioides difficile]|uniref:RCC1 domain-containing protein n=1 Tax=Clostridioides difficile TaxID=1496 RepID=UPI001F480F27